jgi:arylsulfatase A-like enzyme
MIDHDKVVGALLDKLGIAENTIVIYSTDNGPHMNTWPDGGMTPFRSEKNTNWEDDPLAGQDLCRGRLERDRAAP